jgi:crossover junction endodeoxyribonuclease RuvC
MQEEKWMRYVGIDPSTKTGLVVIDREQKKMFCHEIKTSVKGDPQRFMDITNRVIRYLDPNDFIVIEGFSYGSKGNAVSIQYGIGWLIRSELIRNGMRYTEVSPGALKKFASGKGNTKKEDLVLPLFKRWGFEHPSDNVRDAFVLAKISEAMNLSEVRTDLAAFQKDVLENIN